MYDVLLSIQSQMYPTLDISVRFFGIDWNQIFRVSYNLKQIMSQMVVNGTSTAAFADVLLPRYIVYTTVPLLLHTEANFHCIALLQYKTQNITVQCRTMQNNAVQYSTIQYNAVQCRIMQYNAVQCSTILIYNCKLVPGVCVRITNAVYIPGG